MDRSETRGGCSSTQITRTRINNAIHVQQHIANVMVGVSAEDGVYDKEGKEEEEEEEVVCMLFIHRNEINNMSSPSKRAGSPASYGMRVSGSDGSEYEEVFIHSDFSSGSDEEDEKAYSPPAARLRVPISRVSDIVMHVSQLVPPDIANSIRQMVQESATLDALLPASLPPVTTVWNETGIHVAKYIQEHPDTILDRVAVFRSIRPLLDTIVVQSSADNLRRMAVLLVMWFEKLVSQRHMSSLSTATEPVRALFRTMTRSLSPSSTVTIQGYEAAYSAIIDMFNILNSLPVYTPDMADPILR